MKKLTAQWLQALEYKKENILIGANIQAYIKLTLVIDDSVHDLLPFTSTQVATQSNRLWKIQHLFP